jgi:lipoprotein-anchoring transpeptidase ErfK/SrfK
VIHRRALLLTVIVSMALASASCSIASGSGRREPDGASVTTAPGSVTAPGGASRVAAAGASSAAAPDPACDPSTLIGTVVERRVRALERPEPGTREIARFDRINAQGATQVFPLLDRADRSGTTWFRAMLPVRPNGTTGWIRADALELGRTAYRIEIDLEGFHLTVFRACDRIARFPIGVGTRDTPTPRGSFFLNSLLKPPERGSVYGALAFGLSAFSDVITDWEGGGIVGVHGTNDPSSIGSDVSHGCIRMRNGDIRELARTVPLGTPVEIS